jgi:two-component system phosphate regulon sensor histidine kinase PhoR
VGLGFGLHASIRKRVPIQTDEVPPRQGERSDRFDALVRALPLGVMMLDPNTRVRFANRAAGAIFGFDVARVEGVHLIEAVPSIELERRADAALSGEATMGPLIIAAKAGNRHYAVSVYPLTELSSATADIEERITGALVLAEDHTDLLALERARQEFLSNVSHELRTPLSSVKLMLETVLESPDEEAGDIFLPQALTQVDRLVSLVARLLEQARAESGEMTLHMDEVDLEEVVRPIVSSFEPQAAAKGVALEFRAERPIILEADSHRLAQVLVNLIDNALRFTPSGGSVTTDIDVNGGYAVIRVSDTGIGIPYKDLPHIFERFYVVDRSRARDISGAGLGLSIVKHIVVAAGGEIEVDGGLGRGLRIRATFPA